MGGQQFLEGGVLLDTRRLRRVLSFDPEAGRIEVEAGIQWPELLSVLREHPGSWAFAQKQTGADRMSLGGSISANAHGRGLDRPPLVADVESLTLLDPEGELRRCSRDEDGELFALTIGGYGLFGLIYSVELRLVPRETLERVVEVITVPELTPAFESRIAEGYTYGDFQFSTDERSDDFLMRGVFSCYRPVAADTPKPESQRVLSPEDWQRLLYLAHVDKAAAYEAYVAHYLATSGQLYDSDAHQLADYADGYHLVLDEALGAEHPASEVITEIYVPRPRLRDFLEEAAADFRSHQVNLIYGTIRLIRRDEETFLPWARDDYACVIFNLHTVHTPEGERHSADAFRRLIDMAIDRAGSYYLTYHRHANREQVEACHPRFEELLARKASHDPGSLFDSDWHRHHVALLGRR
jgi:FAD/FMN-containing dehydrogenase